MIMVLGLYLPKMGKVSGFEMTKAIIEITQTWTNEQLQITLDMKESPELTLITGFLKTGFTAYNCQHQTCGLIQTAAWEYKEPIHQSVLVVWKEVVWHKIYVWHMFFRVVWKEECITQYHRTLLASVEWLISTTHHSYMLLHYMLWQKQSALTTGIQCGNFLRTTRKHPQPKSTGSLEYFVIEKPQ